MSDIYYTDTGKTLHFDSEIDRGGEGIIYQIKGYTSDVAKIYIKSQSVEVHMKTLAMVQNPPHDPTVNGPTKHRSIAWPSDVLYADQRKTQFAGFVMPNIPMKAFQKILNYIDPTTRKEMFFGGFTWEHLFLTAFNLSSCVAAIHERGYYIGDINESNILVNPKTPVTLIDCDSFQVKDPNSTVVWRCTVGKPEYTAPEIMDYKYKDIDRTEQTDCFALAVIIFQILMEGFHPYAATGPLVDKAPTTRDKIKKGIFPYTASVKGIAPPPLAPSFEVLPPEIRALFDRTFDRGHSDPSLRPSAKEWMSTLNQIRKHFKKCGQNENHRYLNHLKTCPWCERVTKLGQDKDSFPSSAGIQILDPNDPTLTKQDIEKHLLSFIELALQDGNLSQGEETFLLALGLKLQIPERKTKILIEEEKKKKGIKSSGGRTQSSQPQPQPKPQPQTQPIVYPVKPKPPVKLIVGLIIGFIIFISILSKIGKNPGQTIPSGFQVTKTVIGTDFKNDSPIDVSDTFFGPQNKLISYTTYEGAQANKTVMQFQWYRNNTLLTTCNSLTVKASNGNFYCTAEENFLEGNYEVRLLVNGIEKDKISFVIKPVSAYPEQLQSKTLKLMTGSFVQEEKKGVNIKLVSVEIGQDKISIGFTAKSEDHEYILLYGIAPHEIGMENYYGEKLYLVDDKGKKVYSTTGFVGGTQSQYNPSAKKLYIEPGVELYIYSEFPMVSQDAKSFKFYSPELQGHQSGWGWENIPLKSFKVNADIPSPSSMEQQKNTDEEKLRLEEQQKAEEQKRQREAELKRRESEDQKRRLSEQQKAEGQRRQREAEQQHREAEFKQRRLEQQQRAEEKRRQREAENQQRRLAGPQKRENYSNRLEAERLRVEAERRRLEDDLNRQRQQRNSQLYNTTRRAPSSSMQSESERRSFAPPSESLRE